MCLDTQEWIMRVLLFIIILTMAGFLNVKAAEFYSFSDVRKIIELLTTNGDNNAT